MPFKTAHMFEKDELTSGTIHKNITELTLWTATAGVPGY